MPENGKLQIAGNMISNRDRFPQGGPGFVGILNICGSLIYFAPYINWFPKGSQILCLWAEKIWGGVSQIPMGPEFNDSMGVKISYAGQNFAVEFGPRLI